MLLDETFHVEPTGSRPWKFRAFGVLVLLGAACSLVTAQPARSADDQAKGASPAVSKQGEKNTQNDEKPVTSAEEGGKTPAATFSGPVQGTIAYVTERSVESDHFDSRIILPGYELLMQQTVVRELHITAEQKKELQEVAAKYQADIQKFWRIAHPDPTEGRKAFAQWDREHRANIQKQVEKILTPEQAQTLKELAFRQKAHLWFGHSRERLDLSTEQKDKLGLIQQEDSDRLARDSKETTDKVLAVLEPQQRVQFEEAALGPLSPIHYGMRSFSGPGGESIHVPCLTSCPDFSQEGVRKRLGLSATQEEQVRDILGDSPNLTEKLTREFQKLPVAAQILLHRPLWAATVTASGSSGSASPEERKKQQAEFEERLKKRREKQRAELEKHPLGKLGLELHRQFKAILTPEQLASYRKTAFRDVVLSVVNDPLMQKQIGVNEQQKAALRQLMAEFFETHQQRTRDMGGKMLDVLTAPQREKLRKEIERLESQRLATMPAG